ncbi:hypothetical protein JN11_02488 [Mucilaginibacter frigoritolerans]|jgi:hypothetical protein|uniref:Secreted protein with PEP-CTERM sorting signal n=1 Tax=Mucilaginibacter frigoritolerans TaxID=652788 RepID=A0A562U2H9_9SPHI|nr:hypothetical protein [Mucilaginibacter frigoritolerans]TWJ00073.1 hypothetical protein JN11_02488 [Mucilaginibacter frigoritolerans]
MKAGLKTVLILFVFSIMLISVKPVHAQCAQCAAQVETSSKNGSSAANGLNSGILFLLAAPYLAVGVAGLVWYRKYRRKNVNIDMPAKKLHLN